MIKLLDWQKIGVEQFNFDSDVKNFVVYAGTGTGKTPMGSQCVYDHLLENPTDLAIIAVPYRDIKNGWAAILRLYGLEVAAKPSEVAADTSAIVTTYGGASGILNYILRELPQRRLLLVFDEFHHLEETNSWANVFLGLPESQVSRRLMLSGTPWHEAGDLPAEWVRYDDNQEVIAHVRHTYGDNVNADDDTQRNTVPVKFEFFRAHGVEQTVDDEGHLVSVPFDSNETCRSDSMAPFVRFSSVDEFRERLGLMELLHAAVDRLDTLRRFNPLAGGIVFVKDRDAANAVHEYLEQDIGKRVVTVVSDDPLAHKRLKEFRENPAGEWIVAIDMVSEGVDIPRLRVVADFSNRKTLMHIMQRWGRVLRRMRDSNRQPVGNDCDAYIFAIGHAQLRYVAEEIEKDVHRVKAANGSGEGGEPPKHKHWETVEHNGESRGSVFKGLHLEDQIERVADWILTTDFNGVRSARLGLAGAINLAQFLVKTDRVPPEFFREKTDFDAPSAPEPAEESKDDVVREYAKITDHIIQRGFDGDARIVNAELNRQMGVRKWSRDNKTLDQLCKRRDVCKRFYREVFGEEWRGAKR